MGWIARGSALEVVRVTTGTRIAAWCFGAILRDASTRVTAICEFHYDGEIKLLVATTTPHTNAGLVCVFDVKTSKVIRAVEISYRVRIQILIQSFT